MLKWALIPLGLMTAVVMAGPQLVIVGLVFLIIPGLILMLVPTVFVYLSATCLIRAGLPVQSEVGAYFAAFVLTLGLSAVVMQTFRANELRRFRASRAARNPAGGKNGDRSRHPRQLAATRGSGKR